MSDFHFSVQSIPYILVEVISDGNQQSDRYRMLIQASFIVRFANTFSKPSTPSFVVMAIYFDNAHFHRYLVYQPDTSRIAVWGCTFFWPRRLPLTVQTSYALTTFKVSNAYDNFVFLLELYNYASIIKYLQKNLGDPTPSIASLTADANPLPTFTLPPSKKRPRESFGDTSAGTNPDPQLGSRGIRSSVFDDSIVRSQLSSAGYDVAEAWVELGIEPYDRVSQAAAKSRILTVRR